MIPQTQIPTDGQILAYVRDKHGALAAATCHCALMIGGPPAGYVRRGAIQEMRMEELHPDREDPD